MSVGKNIKKYRKAKHISQKEFEKIGISQGFISMLESEKSPASFELIMKIAEFLEVSLLDLIDIPITDSNFLTILKSIDEAFNLDILEVKRSNGTTRYGIFINNDVIQKKLQLYKLMKELKESPNSLDKTLFADMFNSSEESI